MQLLALFIPSMQMDPSLVHHFWDFDWGEVASMHVLTCSLVLFVSGILCSAAGIGGGGVYVSVLMVLGQLSPHNAVPLSKAVVFFGAMATLAMNFKRMATNKKEKVIDFHAVRNTVPASLMGSFFGVMLNSYAGPEAIVVILALVLVFMTCMVGRTFWTQYCDEQLAEVKVCGAGVNPNEGPGPDNECGEDTPLMHKGPRVDEGFTSCDWVLLVALLCVVILSGVLRFHMRACQFEAAGTGIRGACDHPLLFIFGGHMRGWMSNDDVAWAAQAGAGFAAILFGVLVAAFNATSTYSAAGWRIRDILVYQAVGLTTGVLAGFVGIGGGLIFSPFLLAVGMPPGVAVATSSTCVLFTSSSTSLQYVFTDRVIMSLAVTYGLVTLAASSMGTSLVHRMQDTWGTRRSYITLIVVVAVALSAWLAALKFFRMITGSVID